MLRQNVPIFLLVIVRCAIEQASLRSRGALPHDESLEDRPPVDAIEALTTRASPLALTEPAPDAGALAAMLRAAARAPDHGNL